LDTQIADWREEALDRLLSSAWNEYKESLGTGEILEVEAHYETWVAQALNESVSLELASPSNGS
jgi:hypothetical protein